MADLKTDYKDDVLDTSQNINRTFTIKDSSGNILYQDCQIEETTVFETEGDEMNAQVINNTNTEVNQLNNELTELNNDLNDFSFRNNSGTAQYSMDDGSTWVNFKNPTGTKSITANGTYDVTDYASAYVNVPTASFSSVQDLSNNTAYTYYPNSLYIGLGVVDSNKWTVKMYYKGSEILSKGGAYSGTSLISISRSGSTITISNTGYHGIQARLY